MNELSRCPFCGGETYYYDGKIYCADCNVWCSWYEDAEHTVAAFNRRPVAHKFISKFGVFCANCCSEIGENDKYCRGCGMRLID